MQLLRYSTVFLIRDTSGRKNKNYRLENDPKPCCVGAFPGEWTVAGADACCQHLLSRLLNPKFFVMKTFRISIVLALCFFATSFAFASPAAVTPTSELRKEVAKLIKTPELSKKGISETQAFINFTVNENHEIVVLKVICDNDFIKEYIKQSLNAQKVDAEGLEAFTEYNIRVAFRSEKV